MTRTFPDHRRAGAAVIALATALFVALSMVSAAPAHAEYSDDERFELIDRSDNERAAYVHGDHWHGSLPDVPLDDNLSIGAHISDENGDALDLDGSPYSLGVELESGADDGVVEFDDHGDHVHIIGSSDGETSVVFQLLDDGDVEYETPAMTVTVSADADDHANGTDDDHSHDDDHDHSHDDDHDHGHDDDYDHDDDAPVGGVDAGFGGTATAGPNSTTVLLAGMLLFALLAAAVAVRPARSTTRR